MIRPANYFVAGSIPYELRICFKLLLRSLTEMRFYEDFKNLVLISLIKLTFFLFDCDTAFLTLLLLGETFYSFLLVDFAGVFLAADFYLVGVLEDMFDQQLL